MQRTVCWSKKYARHETRSRFCDMHHLVHGSGFQSVGYDIDFSDSVVGAGRSSEPFVEVSDHGIPLRIHGSAQADLIRALILPLFYHLITIIDITIFNGLITIK